MAPPPADRSPASRADRRTTMRADALRNRARVLQVAYEVFASDGLAVPIDEIARRAGVGAGTVYRHFPTKDSLFEAIIEDRIGHLVERARALADDEPAADALFAFLEVLVDEAATDRSLVDALAGAGFDLATAVPDAEARFMAVLDDLLRRAQGAGAVRPDIDVDDVKTLLVGCQAMQRYRSDAGSTQRAIAVVRDGLTARPTSTGSGGGRSAGQDGRVDAPRSPTPSPPGRRRR